MTTFLEMRAITKTFPGVKALDGVELKVQKGEIHAIVGENGAGKSTLMKILSGVYPHGDYGGEILIEGQPAAFKNIADSENSGVIIIHQELALVPQLSIAENLFLGNERAHKGVLNWRDTFQQTGALLKKVGLQEAPDTLVEQIGVGKQQLLEIAKALSKKVRLLILDEPTAALSETDSQKLLELMLELKEQGITCIIISHKLNEIRQVADNITVIRDGASVASMSTAAGNLAEDEIVKAMVGRSLEDRYPDRDHIQTIRADAEPVFAVQDWNVWHPEQRQRQMIKNINLDVHAGEVVGIAGLMGAGRTEFAMSVFGGAYGRNISGQVKIHGQPVDVSTIEKAIKAGIAYVTEDRKSLGLVLEDSIRRNATLVNLSQVASGGVINEGEVTRVAETYRKSMNIRTPNVYEIVENLSGGNQQKVVLAKWLLSDPEILILDEPTRGVDVGAKFEIYSIINQLSASGKGVLMISSELPELLGMCDRIYVMNEGRLVGELSAAQASQESIMSLIVQDNEGQNRVD